MINEYLLLHTYHQCRVPPLATCHHRASAPTLSGHCHHLSTCHQSCSSTGRSADCRYTTDPISATSPRFSIHLHPRAREHSVKQASGPKHATGQVPASARCSHAVARPRTTCVGGERAHILDKGVGGLMHAYFDAVITQACHCKRSDE